MYMYIHVDACVSSFPVTVAVMDSYILPPSQSRLEECQVTVSSLQVQLHSSSSEARRQQEHIRDKAASKVDAYVYVHYLEVVCVGFYV